MEVHGFAQLCFSKDRSWFQGHLVTDDDSEFTLTGFREENSDFVYKIKVHDHEQFETFTLECVEIAWKCGKCRFESKKVEFESQIEYRGQKADIMIQCCLPDLVGHNLDLVVGSMKMVVDHSERKLIPYPTWSS